MEMQNIPIINLRIEVQEYIRLLNTEKFCNQFTRRRKPNDPINTVYESWYGRSELLLTEILRKCILSIESAVCTSTFLQASHRGKLTEEIRNAVDNPFSLRGRGTVDRVYKILPSLVDEKNSLDKYDSVLYEDTKKFYSDIRNPLFHGKELKNIDIVGVREAITFLIKLFDWIDSWMSLSEILKVIRTKRIDDSLNYDSVVDQIVSSTYIPEETKESSIDEIKIPHTKEVTGLTINDYVELQYEVENNKFMRLVLSPDTAMRTMVYLAVAQKQKGWPIPERV